jgi:23S rRNA pseudouridine1911/1915/1917 synthase
MTSEGLRESITCNKPNGGIRPDKFLTELFPLINRSRIKRAIENGNVWVNGVPIVKKQRFEEGDNVELLIPHVTFGIPQAVSIPLDVIFEDEDIIVVNKAPGMVAHPGNGTSENTLVHALLSHCGGKLSNINGTDRPGIVHRLDKDTSGLMIAAKSDRACSRLIELFGTRDLTKEYLTLICGCPDTQSGTIDAGIGRHPTRRTKMGVIENGREARTDWMIRSSRAPICFVQCRIHTGRTHQIRVHMSHIGHPIVGDCVYGYHPSRLANVNFKADRPLLHAWRLVFDHPVSQKSMEFKVDPPSDFEPWLKWIEGGAK